MPTLDMSPGSLMRTWRPASTALCACQALRPSLVYHKVLLQRVLRCWCTCFFKTYETQRMCVWQLRIERQNALRFTFVLPEETCVKMHDHFLFAQESARI